MRVLCVENYHLTRCLSFLLLFQNMCMCRYTPQQTVVGKMVLASGKSVMVAQSGMTNANQSATQSKTACTFPTPPNGRIAIFARNVTLQQLGMPNITLRGVKLSVNFNMNFFIGTFNIRCSYSDYILFIVM